MPLAAPPGPLWTADAKEPHPIEIEHTDDAVIPEAEISYQIKNVPEIEEKNITGEHAIIRWHGILNHIATRIVVALTATLFSALLYFGDEKLGSWVPVVAMLLSILLGQYMGWLVLLFVRVKRNPYSRLIAIK